MSVCLFSSVCSDGRLRTGSLRMPHLKQQAKPAQKRVTSVLSWLPLLCTAGSSCSSPCRRPEMKAASCTHSQHTSAGMNAGWWSRAM